MLTKNLDFHEVSQNIIRFIMYNIVRSNGIHHLEGKLALLFQTVCLVLVLGFCSLPNFVVFALELKDPDKHSCVLTL